MDIFKKILTPHESRPALQGHSSLEPTRTDRPPIQ